MDLFKSYTYAWWQVGIFKLALLAIGVLIGATWPEFFTANMTAVAFIAALATAYILFTSFRQARTR